MKDRICSKCGKTKKLTEEFFQPDTGPEGFNVHCRICRSEYFKQWRKKKYKEDPKYGIRKAYKELYNIRIEYYDDRLKEQQGHCAMCSATTGDAGTRLHIDHNHDCCDTRAGQRPCGKCLRGLLCGPCNRRLGALEDLMKESQVIPQFETWTDRAMHYLSKWRGIHQSQTQEMNNA